MILLMIVFLAFFIPIFVKSEKKINMLEEEVAKCWSEINYLSERVNEGNFDVKEAENSKIRPEQIQAAEPVSIEQERNTDFDTKRKALYEQFLQEKERKSKQELAKKTASKRSETSDFENVFGKHILGYLAAVLVFVGMLAFGSLIFNYVDSVIKTLMVFVFSFAITVFGIWLHKRNENAFSESVMGCGIGSIFISIFISHLFFETFTDIIAFVLVLIWAIGVFVLSKKIQSKSLLYIAHIGCLVSLIMAMGSTTFEDRMIEISVYQIVTFALLLKMNKNTDHYLFKITTFCAMSLNIILSWLCYDYMFMDDLKNIVVIAIITISSCVLHIIGHKQNIKHRLAESVGSMSLLLINLIILLSSLNYMMTKQSWLVLNIVAFFTIAMVLMTLILTDLDGKEFSANMIMSSAFLSIIALCGAVNDYDTGSVIIPGVLFYGIILLILYWKNKRIEYLASCVATIFIDGFAALFLLNGFSLVLYEILVVAISLLIGIAHNGNVFSFAIPSIVMINICFVPSIIIFVSSLEKEVIVENTLYVLVMIFVAVINVIIKQLNNKLADKIDIKQVTDIFIEVILHIFIIVAVCLVKSFIDVEYSTIEYLLLLTLSMMILLIGVMDLPKIMKIPNHARGLFCALKFTALILIQLATFTTLFDEQFVFSIIVMVIATLMILFGFKFTNKSIRIYGLILILASVLKIVIVDLWGQDSLIRVIALMLGGIICFAISALYNKIEKKYTAEQLDSNLMIHKEGVE